jgi:hypothetical protein
MHQRPSRCWICLNVSAATSERRSPGTDKDGEYRAVAQPLGGGGVGRAQEGLCLPQ